MAKKYYAVFAGRKTGIYTNWNDALESVHGYPNANHKAYPTRSEAEAALREFSTESEWHTPDTATDCEIQIFCDGACQPNPGEAGSGIAVYRSGQLSKLWYGHYQPKGTNNTAELLALQYALRIATQAIERGKTVEICCDSIYALNCNRRWAPNWKQNGWKRSGGGKVLNATLSHTYGCTTSGTSMPPILSTVAVPCTRCSRFLATPTLP